MGHLGIFPIAMKADVRRPPLRYRLSKTNFHIGPRCNRGDGGGVGLSTCLCLHAEENALLEAGRDRIREGAILYCDTCPCLTCTVKITQVGISEVVYSQGYNMDSDVRYAQSSCGTVANSSS